MNSKNLRFRDRYIKAKIALEELLTCDNTIDAINIYINKDKKVTIALDLYAHLRGDEKVMTKVKDFIPDFVLESEI